MGGAVSALAFPAPPKEWGKDRLEARPDLIKLNTPEGDIGAIHIRNFSRCTILYSHGNAEDLGQILQYLDAMAHTCNADVLAYDYCGYGVSEGSPSEQNAYMAIDAAYNHLTRTCKVDPSRIVAFGRSIGSGPTVDLVSRTPEIRAMVLQSPLESGGRAVLGNTASWLFHGLDIFRNYEKIEAVSCPVFIMHGTADKVVPCHNGRAIHAQCRNAVDPWWVNGRGHNDMPDREILERIRRFLDRLYTEGAPPM